MEEDQDEQATSIRGRLLMLVNRIKGQASRADKPAEKEQAAPCKEHPATCVALFTMFSLVKGTPGSSRTSVCNNDNNDSN